MKPHGYDVTWDFYRDKINGRLTPEVVADLFPEFSQAPLVEPIYFITSLLLSPFGKLFVKLPGECAGLHPVEARKLKLPNKLPYTEVACKEV
ncbi:MAG: hypothetical protein M3272_03510 [Actinomycetota bacterium]|nr:hypothetical protein [Actinomycetota bacterium]